MTIDLPENMGLNGDTLIAFQRQAEPMLAALESGETGTISVAGYRQKAILSNPGFCIQSFVIQALTPYNNAAPKGGIVVFTL